MSLNVTLSPAIVPASSALPQRRNSEGKTPQASPEVPSASSMGQPPSASSLRSQVGSVAGSVVRTVTSLFINNQPMQLSSWHEAESGSKVTTTPSKDRQWKPTHWLHGTDGNTLLPIVSRTQGTMFSLEESLDRNIAPTSRTCDLDALSFQSIDRAKLLGRLGDKAGFNAVWSEPDCQSRAISSLRDEENDAMLAIRDPLMIIRGTNLTVYGMERRNENKRVFGSEITIYEINGLIVKCLQARQLNDARFKQVFSADLKEAKKLIDAFFINERKPIALMRRILDVEVPKEPDLTGEKLQKILHECGVECPWEEREGITQDYQLPRRLKSARNELTSEGLEGILGGRSAGFRHYFAALLVLKNHDSACFGDAKLVIEGILKKMEDKCARYEKWVAQAFDGPLGASLMEVKPMLLNAIPFPLVVGSSQAQINGRLRSLGHRGDIVLDGSATFGKEIDVLITNNANLERLQSWLKANGLGGRVSVFSNEEVAKLLG